MTVYDPRGLVFPWTLHLLLPGAHDDQDLRVKVVRHGRTEPAMFDDCVNVRKVRFAKCHQGTDLIKVKVKEADLYSAFIEVLHARRSGTDHTVLPANYTVPASTS